MNLKKLAQITNRKLFQYSNKAIKRGLLRSFFNTGEYVYKNSQLKL